MGLTYKCEHHVSPCQYLKLRAITCHANTSPYNVCKVIAAEKELDLKKYIMHLPKEPCEALLKFSWPLYSKAIALRFLRAHTYGRLHFIFVPDNIYIEFDLGSICFQIACSILGCNKLALARDLWFYLIL